MKRFISNNKDQYLIFCENRIDDKLPENHIVRSFDKIIDGLDLSFFNLSGKSHKEEKVFNFLLGRCKNLRFAFRNKIDAYIPNKKADQKESTVESEFIENHKFVCNEDHWICPDGKKLEYSTDAIGFRVTVTASTRLP